ncbi:MAG: hypothetical protein AAGC55_32910, partial [Myxococcota bacterium]
FALLLAMPFEQVAGLYRLDTGVGGRNCLGSTVRARQCGCTASVIRASIGVAAGFTAIAIVIAALAERDRGDDREQRQS